MTNSWPTVSLGEVLTHRKEFITIDDSQEYKRCRIQLHAKGIILRDIIEGTRIKTKDQQVCRVGEFLVAEIDAKVGGFGIVPDDLAGAIVSSHYFLFKINQERLDKGFLDYYIRTPTFRDQVTARGTTNYAAIRPRQVLEYSIPLPPLPEQQRLVAKIEALAAKIEEARGLRSAATDLSESLLKISSKTFFKANNGPTGSLVDIALRITKGESPSWQGFSYQESGPVFIRSENVLWGKLDLSRPVHIPQAFHTKLSRSQLNVGDVLINLVGASIGRACIVPSGIGSANINQAVAVISPNKELLDNNYLLSFFLSQPTQEILHGGKVETARPNISLADLRKLKISLPPLDEQLRIVAYLDDLQTQVDALKKLQAQTAAELDALLPAILDRAFKGELL